MRAMSYNILDGVSHAHPERMTLFRVSSRTCVLTHRHYKKANGFDRDGRTNVHLHAHDLAVRAREAGLVLLHSAGTVKLT